MLYQIAHGKEPNILRVVSATNNSDLLEITPERMGIERYNKYQELKDMPKDPMVEGSEHKIAEQIS